MNNDGENEIRTDAAPVPWVWGDKQLHQNLRIRIYKACILTYGSEVWFLHSEVIRKMNGANASMMSVITGSGENTTARGIDDNENV